MTISHSLLALLIYAAWTLSLVSSIAALRVTVVQREQRRANSFSVAGDDVSPFSGRLCRAHANCFENLPTFAALIAVAYLSGNAAITDGLALMLVFARVMQSSIHLMSTRSKPVLARFAFMLVQIVIQIYWVVALACVWLKSL
jgi:uncharacterized MAPEG superfamily protein